MLQNLVVSYLAMLFSLCYQPYLFKMKRKMTTILIVVIAAYLLLLWDFTGTYSNSKKVIKFEYNGLLWVGLSGMLPIVIATLAVTVLTYVLSRIWVFA